MKNLSFSLKNYFKPTPAKLKAVADFLLATILVVDPLIHAMPDFPKKEWILWGWNSFVVLFKFVSKGFANKEQV